MTRPDEEVRLGVYRHYKGPLYQVIGLAHDANVDGREAVVYVGLELNEEHLGPRLAVRTADDFLFGHMHLEAPGEWSECSYDCRRAGAHFPRFAYQGPRLTEGTLSSRADFVAATRAGGDGGRG